MQLKRLSEAQSVSSAGMALEEQAEGGVTKAMALERAQELLGSDCNTPLIVFEQGYFRPPS